MATSIARMSYMGNCLVDGVLIPCTSMSSNVEGNMIFYDHAIGLRDTNFTEKGSKKPADNTSTTVGGKAQIQKRFYRPAPSIFKGKFAGPISINSGGDINIKSLIDKAISGETIGQIDFIYKSTFTASGNNNSGESGEGHKVLNAVIESLVINLNAGDVASFDIGVVAKKPETEPTFKPKSGGVCSKILTWDRCTITAKLPGETAANDIVSFNINIKNPIIPIYVAGDITKYDRFYYYAPTELRIGMQEVTGSVSIYGFGTKKTKTDSIVIKLGDSNTWTVKVVYNPTSSSASGSSEPYVAQTPFIGAGDTAIWS